MCNFVVQNVINI